MHELVIYALFAAALLWGVFRRNEKMTAAEWILCAAVVLVLGVRFSINGDTKVYAWIFNVVEHPLQEAMVSHARRNVLYSLLSWVVKIAFGEFRWLVLIQNVLILLGCGWVIFRFSKNIILSFLLFTGGGMLEVYYGSGVRQALAMTVFLAGFYAFLPKKKYLLYELMCLIAFGFQDIALASMILPLLYLFVKPFKAHPVRVILIFTVLSLILLGFITFFMSDFAYWLIDTVGPAPVWTHVIAYARFQQFSIMGIGMETVFFAGTLLLYYFAEKDGFDDFTYFSVLVFLSSIWIYYAFACYDLMSRVSDFIQIIMLVLIPQLFAAIPKKSVKAAAAFALIALNAVLLYADITANLRRMNEVLGTSFTIRTYPYVCVFDTKRVAYYQVLLDGEE